MSDNPDHHLHHPRNRQNNSTLDMQFSLLLSRSLDVLGYSQDMIRHRVDDVKLSTSLNSIQYADAELVYAGSQSEGVVANYGSDFDVMAVINNVICADNIQPFSEYRNITLFQTDSRDTGAGYIKLKPIEIGHGGIAECLFKSDNNITYISSEFLMNKLMGVAMEFNFIPINVTIAKAGPSIPFYSKFSPDVTNDIVVCFKCYCPVLLRSWLRRPRQYNWPSRNNLYQISQMEAHVVPVGCKGSDT